MKRIFLVFAAIFFFSFAHAQRVSVSDAHLAASNFMSAAEPSLSISQMSLYKTFADNNGEPVIYIFNIDNYGFIAFGADISFDPIIGYSLNGAYDSTLAHSNLKGWLNSYVMDVDAVKQANTKDDNIIKYHNNCIRIWKELLSNQTSSFASKAWDTVGPLIETKWDQGGGYNNYCPTYAPGPNGHSYTGCVATAMAQIIRYHRYPRTGFSRSSYNHPYHGYQYAAYDSVIFDFNKMPHHVSTGSLQSYQHNVSLLCYYCGVSVNMNYLNPNHTSGSGAYSIDVPDGFKYFGYENAYYIVKQSDAHLWDSLLCNELDNGRPVYYSGSNSEGGHAFICDGYRTNGSYILYSFNFGWSGYGDGYFTISNLGGYSTGQAAVLNIIPSNFTALGDTIYIASDGEGGGSSWDDANPNLHDAIPLAKLCNKKYIWVKNGTYKGNISSQYSFEMKGGVNIYGGFNGTETSIDQRSGEGKTILSGDGKRIAFFSPANTSNAAIYDVTFSDGHAQDGSGATIYNGIRVERCNFENNISTEGAALSVRNNTVYNCIINNNYGGGVTLSSNSSLRNSLIAHNDGFGIQLNNSGIDGCDIVCNNGIGIINDTPDEKKIRNSVIWNNSTQLSSDDLGNIFFCAIEGLGEKDSNSNFGLTHENRPDDGIGPIFMDPDITLGPSESLGDWQISSRSPLVDAGDTNKTGAYKLDLAGENRFRNGRADIGCYEWIPGNAISDASSTTCRIYPNPATSTLVIEGIQGQADIYDIIGRQILSVTLNDESSTIDISSFPNGLYIIRSKSITKKFYKL